MKKVLIVYIEMVTGGSTTSLLSILNNLDYKQYQVDLLLSQNSGDLFSQIPKEVNVLPQAIPNLTFLRAKRAFSPICIYNFIKSRLIAKKHQNFIVSQQITAYDNAKYSRKLEQGYDIAVSFLELWPTYYVADFVQAKRKIAWIHVDYHEVGFVPGLDTARFKNLTKIVLVSNTCKDSFVKSFPQYKDKAVCIENILSTETFVWLETGMNEIMLFLAGDSTGYFGYVTDSNRYTVPAGLAFLFGKGVTVLGGSIYGFASDIGWINDIWRGGIFYSLIIYVFYGRMLLDIKRFGRKQTNFHNFLAFLFLGTFLVVNFKGPIIGVTEVMTVTFMLYLFRTRKMKVGLNPIY